MYSFNNEMGVWKHTILFSFYGMTKMNYAAKIPLKVQLLKGKKNSHVANCCISSFKLFHLVQIIVYSCEGLRGQKKKKKHLKPYTCISIFHFLPRQRSNPPLPRHRKWSNAQGLPGWGGGGVLKFQLDQRITVLTLVMFYDCFQPLAGVLLIQAPQKWHSLNVTGKQEHT